MLKRIYTIFSIYFKIKSIIKMSGFHLLILLPLFIYSCHIQMAAIFTNNLSFTNELPIKFITFKD